MHIVCNNTKCKNYRAFDKPKVFKPTANFNSFIDEIASGECKLSHSSIISEVLDLKGYKYPQNRCLECDGNCNNVECLHNENLKCTRTEIFIDDSLVSKDFICKCFSNRKISGHFNMMSMLNSDGSPKGGSIDDAYSEKLHADDKKTKIFPDGHMRQAK